MLRLSSPSPSPPPLLHTLFCSDVELFSFFNEIIRDIISLVFFREKPNSRQFFSSCDFCLQIGEMCLLVFYADMVNLPHFLFVDFLFTPFPDLDISNIILRNICDMSFHPPPHPCPAHIHLFLQRGASST